jgi:hypothetical protein
MTGNANYRVNRMVAKALKKKAKKLREKGEPVVYTGANGELRTEKPQPFILTLLPRDKK